MAAISITAANVSPVAGSEGLDVIATLLAGETIAAGKSVAWDPTTETWKLFDANSATAALAVLGGVAVSSASAGQPLAVQRGGEINIGATVSVNALYIGGATPGDITPIGDLTTGWKLNVVGAGTTTGRLRLASGPGFLKTGVAS